MKKKKRRKKACLSPPALEQLEAELKRETERRQYARACAHLFCVLITSAALVVLIVTFWLPVLRIYGSSMEPSLEKGELVLFSEGSDCRPGDIIAFFSNGRVIVKRVIAESGDWIDIEEDGTVCVNGRKCKEPYLKEKVRGTVDMELPCKVPEGCLFVLGDHRSVSVDSRDDRIGFVDQEQVIGRIVFRLWPIQRAGRIKIQEI